MLIKKCELTQPRWTAPSLHCFCGNKMWHLNNKEDVVATVAEASWLLITYNRMEKKIEALGKSVSC